MDVLSPHLRGIVIAGALAVVALALGFVTLAMNRSSSSALPYRPLAEGAAPRRLQAGEARSQEGQARGSEPASRCRAQSGPAALDPRGLAAHRVTVVALTSSQDSVAALATRETQAGARLGGASFVRVTVDRDGGDASALTAVLGKLPTAPATLVYVRPGTVYLADAGLQRQDDRAAGREERPERAHRHDGGASGKCAGDDHAGGGRSADRHHCSVSSPTGAKELFVRHARKEGRSVAVLRAIDYGQECVVETEVFPPNAVTPLRAGPYTFADSRQAVAFVTEAVEALMYLGCDIQAA